MVLTIETPPITPAHLASRVLEHGIHPVDNGIEMVLQLVDVRVVAVLRHVIVDVALADPLQRSLQNRLALRVAGHIRLPAVHVGVARVREHLTGHRHERAVIRGVTQFLLHERHTDNVDGLEPRLNLRRLTLADVNRQGRVNNELLLVSIQTVEIAGLAAQLNSKRP